MAGRICLWHYSDRSPDYPGFHLSADRAGATQLLTLLANLAKARSPQIANVTLDPVTADVLAVPNNRGARITPYQHWDVVVDPRFAPERLHFTVVGGRVRIELSPVQVESVAAGVEDIRERRGGYSIGDDDEHQLWFWWQDDLILPE